MSDFIASLATDVPVARSIQQIYGLIGRFNAREFTILHDVTTHRPNGIAFTIADPHLASTSIIPVRVDAPTEQLIKILRRERPRWELRAIEAQAERIAWRQVHDYIRSSLIAVQWGLLSLGEAFLASVVATLPNGERSRIGDYIATGALFEQKNDRLLLKDGRTP